MVLLALLSSAHAVTVDVGVGYRRTFDAYDGRPFGLRAFGRLGLADHFAVELGAYGRFPGSEVSGLTHTLVGIAYEGNNETSFRQPVDREIASFGAFVAMSPWARRHEKKPTAWIYGLLGVETQLIVKDYASINPDYAAGVEGAEPAVLSADPVTRFVPGPALGLAFDAWFLDRVGVRAMVVERAAVQTEPDYGNRLPNGDPEPLDTVLTLSAALSLDLMVTF